MKIKLFALTIAMLIFVTFTSTAKNTGKNSATNHVRQQPLNYDLTITTQNEIVKMFSCQQNFTTQNQVIADAVPIGFYSQITTQRAQPVNRNLFYNYQKYIFFKTVYAPPANSEIEYQYGNSRIAMA